MGRLLTPVKAIRAKCLDCSVYSNNEVKLCPVEECPLYPYRMGKRPKGLGKPSRSANPTKVCASKKRGFQKKIAEVGIDSLETR